MGLQLPRSQGPSVDPSIAPTVRVRPSMDEDNFGGGRAAAGAFGQARALGGDLQGIAFQEEMRAQETQLNELDVEMGQLEQQQRLALSGVQGKDALAARERMFSDYDKQAQEIQKKATSNRVRERLGLAVERRRIALEGFATPYVRGQMLEYEAEQADAKVKIEADNAFQAYQDPVRVQMALDEQEKTILSHARASGKPAEWAVNKVKGVHSETIRGVITRHLEARNYGVAKEQFDLAVKAEALTERDHAALSRQVESGSSLGAAQQAVDGFMKSATTREGLMEMARGIKDPETRSVAEQYARVRWTERQQDIKEAENEAVKNAFGRIDADDGKAMNAEEAVGPTIWDRITDPKDRAELSKAFRIKRGLEAAVTDPEKFYALKMMGANEATRKEFLGLNLMRFRNSLTPQKLEEIQEFQVGLAKEDQKALREADGFLSKEQVINQFADTIKDKTERVSFKQEMDREIARWQRDNDSSEMPPKAEIEKAMSGLIKERTSFFGGNKTRTFAPQSNADVMKEIDRLDTAVQGIAESDPEELQKIIDALGRARIHPTPEKILEMYERGLKRGR